jgi:glycosyltransferase involved in cell wall biosynthesis
MRILHAMLADEVGGVQMAFAHYAALLRYLGHQVVCCVRPGAAILSRLPADCVVELLPHVCEIDPLAVVRASRLIAAHSPDVLVVHGKRAARIFDRARFVSRRTLPLVDVLHRPRFKGIARADRLICVSRALADGALATGVQPDRVIHVPNFLPQDACRAAPPHRSNLPVVGFLGRLVPEKGCDLLLDALALLARTGVPVRARIAGSGPAAPALKAQAARLGIAAEIDWLGWVDDVSGFYSSIDVLCVPSRSESFGFVVLEAFSSETAVIATRTSGPAEIIDHGRNGLLCELTAGALAAELGRLVQSPVLAAGLAAQARVDVQRYLMPAVAPRVASVLDSACAA